MVFEIVCEFPVTQADAKAACSNYQNKVTIPPVGSHVRIVRVYVEDAFHAQWMEIHPVASWMVVYTGTRSQRRLLPFPFTCTLLAETQYMGTRRLNTAVVIETRSLVANMTVLPA